MFGAPKLGRFRSMASLILVVNVVGELQRKRTLAASLGFLAAARLSCWLKYNGFATVRKTTKLIEVGHRVFQDYRHTSTFFTFFYVFSKIQKVVTFTVFAVPRTFSRTML